MKNYFSSTSLLKVKSYIVAHKIVSTIFAIIILILGYYGYKNLTSTAGEIRYVTTTAQKGTIISSISGSGQVSATNQVDVKSKVSGDITWVNVKPGQTVYAGQALAGLDNTSAKAAVADAEASLAESKLQLQKDTASAPIDYQNTLANLETAKQDLDTTFNDTFNTLSDTYLDLPSIMTGMQNILYGYDLNGASNMWNIDYINGLFSNVEENKTKITLLSDSAKSDYAKARSKYDPSLISYKKLSRLSSDDEIMTQLDQAIDTTTNIAQSLQSELNLLGGTIDMAQIYNMRLPSGITTMQTNARNYLTTVNTDLSKLLSQKKSITTSQQTIQNDQNQITLLKVGNENGSNPISLQISQSNLVKQERNLEDLKITLSQYTVVAPFAGTIASVSAKVGDTAGTIATIVTSQQVATLSLNEVDAAKIAVGQKATLTFDAIDSLSLTGTVAEIDPVGTVSQGVVSYTAKITFDTQDARIKPGMTVNATIQTAVHADVLIVPSSAVKTLNGNSFVQVFNTPLVDGGSAGTVSTILPTQIPVTVGISDDTNIEIVSGIAEGQQVVSRTITSTTKTTTTTTTGARTTGAGATRPFTGAVRIGG